MVFTGVLSCREYDFRGSVVAITVSVIFTPLPVGGVHTLMDIPQTQPVTVI